MRRLLSALLLTLTLPAVSMWAQQDSKNGGVQLISALQVSSQQQSNGAGFLGVRLADVDEDHAKTLKLGDARGVEVKAVMEGSPADSAGIQPGDVIMGYNGETVLGAEQLTRMVRETPPGRKVKVQYWRAGRTHVAIVAVGVAANSGSSWPQGVPIPNWQAPSLDFPTPLLIWRNSAIGIDFERVDSQLADYFGVKGGVLIRLVKRGSPADRAGVRAGDVIFSVAQQTLSTEHDFSFLLKQCGATVPVSLMRDHKRLDLTISLPQQ
jgi:serine protease Do